MLKGVKLNIFISGDGAVLNIYITTHKKKSKSKYKSKSKSKTKSRTRSI